MQYIIISRLQLILREVKIGYFSDIYMLKLLIVDDEPVILEGLKVIIDWEQYGFELIGAANDGEAALRIVKNDMPDVIITDIKMNFISGLELISLVKDINDKVEFILISAYSDFEYAKQACDMAVFSYILKPIVKDELLKVVLSLKERIEKEKKLSNRLINMQALIKDEYPVLVNKFLNSIFDNALSADEINRKCRMLNISFNSNGDFIVILIKVNKSEKADKDFDYQYGLSIVNKVVEDIINKEFEFLSTYLTDTSLGLLLWKNEITKADRDRVDELLQRGKNTVGRIARISLSIARGTVVNAVENVYLSFDMANKVMKHSLILGSDIFLTAEDVSGILKSDGCFPGKYEMAIIEGIKCNSLKLVKKNLYEFTQCFKSGEYSYSSACFSMHQLYMSVIKELMSDEYFVLDMEDTLKSINEFSGKPIDEIADLVYGHIEICVNKNNAIKKNYIKGIVSKTIESIRANFHDPSLTIKDVAHDININASYLGQVFRKEMGNTFNEYLSALRIDEAKTLLKSSNMKIYEIAENVGYENYPYFNVVFKRILGITPTEYREKYYTSKEYK